MDVQILINFIKFFDIYYFYFIILLINTINKNCIILLPYSIRKNKNEIIVIAFSILNLPCIPEIKPTQS